MDGVTWRRRKSALGREGIILLSRMRIAILATLAPQTSSHRFDSSAGIISTYSHQCNPDAASQHFCIDNYYTSLYSCDIIFSGSTGVSGSNHNQHNSDTASRKPSSINPGVISFQHSAGVIDSYYHCRHLVTPPCTMRSVSSYPVATETGMTKSCNRTGELLAPVARTPPVAALASLPSLGSAALMPLPCAGAVSA